MPDKQPYILNGKLNPDMPTQELLLHCGELTKSEIKLARAVLRWAASVENDIRILSPDEIEQLMYNAFLKAIKETGDDYKKFSWFPRNKMRK